MSIDFNSDRMSGNRQPAWGSAGPGAHQSFLCAKPRQVLGRKRQRVQGLAQWVRHACVALKGAK